MAETHLRPPKVTIEKSDDFKLFFADGVYVWLGQDSGTLTFFVDTMDAPEINDKGAAIIKSVKRRLFVELRISPKLYDNMIEWMIQQRELLQKTQNPPE